MKRIFAVISDTEFEKCIERGREEGLDLGQVLAILVHLYATADLELKEYKEYTERLREERPWYTRLSDVERRARGLMP